MSRPIQLDSLLHEAYDRTPYYDELKIPVGRSGNQVQYFRLDVESTGKSAALIAGGTGSGKTTFLHTLILSGAMAYSPEELEYYLIDFKDGVEFSNYLKRPGEASAYIPHVSFLSLKNRVEDAYDVLHKISALKEQRNRLFNRAGATDFKTYHMSKKVQSGELPRLKRTIVIIDEYQNMLEATGNGSAALAAKCSARLLALLEMDADESRFADRTVAEIEKEQGITYAPLQRQAVELAAKVGVILLTGGPGTGKTTTVRGIVALFQKMGLNIVLAAPTGRAAKRMSELTGMEAQTVHRLLGMTWNEAAHQVTFQKTEKEPLEAEAVIVDEMSMVDVSLFSALLRALRPGTRLVLVGDADQLPSVGAGNVFSDLIRSKKIETVFLREVFRQAEQSAIIRNAHRVNLGESPDLKGNQGDFFFLCRRDAQRAVATVLELCKTRLPDNMHIPAEQIQVLTPTRKGPCGTTNLNRLLQEALNPRTPGKREILWGERVFRVGDRIMQTRNDYDVVWQKDDGTVGTGMFNGDVGRIAEIDAGGEWLALDFDGRKAPYSVEMLSEIDLAYAQTVHKAQGSEYRCVVLAALPSAPSLMVRGVLYTALTRARELLVIVGDDAAIRSMAANDRQQKRYSGLKWRLCHAGDASE